MNNEDGVKVIRRAREMAQQVIALAALPQALCQIPSNKLLLTSYNCDHV